MSSFTGRGELDYRTGLIIVCQGKKKSGKSTMGKLLVMTYPGDVLVLDVAGDDGPMGPGVVDITGTVETLPRRFPEHLRPAKDQRMILRYVPDAGSPTHLEDMDAFVGLAYEHSSKEKPAAIIIHEIGVVSPSGKTKPHMRRALMHSRHHALTMIGCGPRARTTEPLWLAQADLVYTFKMPNAGDKEHTADTIGWETQPFVAAVDELHGHEYLRFDANQEDPEPCPDGHDEDEWARTHPELRLTAWPPLPEDTVKRVEEWAHNVPAPHGAEWASAA